MAKKTLIVVFAGLGLYIWWNYPLLLLRGGADRGSELAAADAEISDLRKLIKEYEKAALDYERMEERVDHLKEALVWAGDPMHPNEIERDTRSVCPLIKDYFEAAVRFVASFTCSVSQGLPLLFDGRALPLTLSVGGADPGDGERLVLAAENHPAMRLQQMSVFGSDKAPENAERGEDGRLLYDRETAMMTVEFYMRKEPPDAEREEAEQELRQHQKDRDMGLLRKRLIGKSDTAQTGGG